jgi:uncharacterized protein (TIGR00299 family) protein
MILAAMCDLGADAAALEACVRSLPVERFRILTEEVVEKGFRAKRVRVEVPDKHHPHRGLSDIVSLLDGAGFSAGLKTLAASVFKRLAAAEAVVHGTTPDRIHFHEVGAMDSIVDIVGCCFCLLDLRIDAVVVSPLPVGSGSTSGSHGVMPLPVPAVAELLRGQSVIQTSEPFEMVTPTGAALLAAWRDSFPPPSPMPAMTISAIGTGAGRRVLNSRPNILRTILLEDSITGHAAADDECTLLECNIDDCNPQLIGALAESLIRGPALDVFTVPIQMKKQRPGVLLSVMCPQDRRSECIRLIFEGSTTFGIRETTVRRTTLDRRHEVVETPYGPVRVKVGSVNGHDSVRSPEYEDCRALAEKHGVAVRRVYEAAVRAAPG